MQSDGEFGILFLSMGSLPKFSSKQKQQRFYTMIGMFFVFAFSVVLLAMLWRQAGNLEAARKMERDRLLHVNTAQIVP